MRCELVTEELRLRTAAWHGDREVTLPVPASWQVKVMTPDPTTALSDGQISAQLDAPIGQPPVRELARGKSRPVIIVDDLNRPTPAHRALPALLGQLRDAGIPARDVHIVMGPGTHGAPSAGALLKKTGEASSECQLHVHDCEADLVNLGKTTFGTPVLVNRIVAEGDLILGVGGVYPNQSAGFGGGSKLALGVLGFRSIAALHFGHRSLGWGVADSESDIRRDLDEIAEKIRLESMITFVVNEQREAVRVACGDHRRFYRDMLGFAREMYHAPVPDEDVDVVLSNAYPNDLSLTFTRMKGMAPLRRAPVSASRIVMGACAEGLGYHGLFPFLNARGDHARRMVMARGPILMRSPRVVVRRIGGRVARRLHGRPNDGATPNPIWLYRPEQEEMPPLPDHIPGMRVTSCWDDVVEGVTREQGGRTALRAVVYTCAPLQWLD